MPGDSAWRNGLCRVLTCQTSEHPVLIPNQHQNGGIQRGETASVGCAHARRLRPLLSSQISIKTGDSTWRNGLSGMLACRTSETPVLTPDQRQNGGLRRGETVSTECSIDDPAWHFGALIRR